MTNETAAGFGFMFGVLLTYLMFLLVIFTDDNNRPPRVYA